MSYKNDICEQASKIISGERQGQYGSPEDSFAVIAHLWNGYKGGDYFDSNDVAVMMALMKIARISNGVFKEDSYVDAIGYLAIGAELSNGEAIENWRNHQKEYKELAIDKEKITLTADDGSVVITPEGITATRNYASENYCSDACGIDILPGGDPDEVNDGDENEEENQIKDCYHCFYATDSYLYGKNYNGCLRGNHGIKDIGCMDFKSKVSCSTCSHNENDSEDGGDDANNNCYHCFYHSNGGYDGCLRGNSAIPDIGCKDFKSKETCLTCSHNDGSLVQDDENNLRVLCKLDDEYHNNTAPCKNWEEGKL